MRSSPESFRYRAAPVFTLIVLAPLISVVLPGHMRISALFAFPIVMGIWGCGAVLIRAAVRHWRLGWLNMLLLALALSIAEECLIQQTSLAPLAWQLAPGEPYARAWGVNYLYLLWALGHEAVFVVFVPVVLTELIFKSRREQPWLGKWSAGLLGALFVLTCIPAWYSWTQVARPMIFHVPIYTPPALTLTVAALAMLLLIGAAIGPFRRALLIRRKPLAPAPTWLLGVGGFVVAVIWYGLVLLSYGTYPSVSPAIPVAVGLILTLFVLWLLPRYAAHADWRDAQRLSVVFGTVVGAMVSGFVAFIYGALKLDLYGKMILNVLATIFLIAIGRSLRSHRQSGSALGAESEY